MKLACANNLFDMENYPNHPEISVITPDMKILRVKFSYKQDDTIVFHLENDTEYPYTELGYYDPRYDGIIDAIRIYNRDGYQPTATLSFAFGGSFTFPWDRVDFRRMFNRGINAYTIMYDTRICRPFTEMLHPYEGDSGWDSFNNIKE